LNGISHFIDDNYECGYSLCQEGSLSQFAGGFWIHFDNQAPGGAHTPSGRYRDGLTEHLRLTANDWYEVATHLGLFTHGVNRALFDAISERGPPHVPHTDDTWTWLGDQLQSLNQNRKGNKAKVTT